MNSPSRLKLTLVIASVILCWAYSPIGVHMGLRSYSPGQLALLRFLIASVFMGGVALVLDIGRPRLRDVPWLLVLGFSGCSCITLASTMGSNGSRRRRPVYWRSRRRCSVC